MSKINTKTIIDKADMDTITTFLKEEQKNSKKCTTCNRMCGPGYGDGKRCLVCLSHPTAETMRMVLR